MANPFFYGNPVPPELFLNRRRELRRVVGRIVGHGQSTAVVGEPRSGKTSLLHYLSAPETRAGLYGDGAARLLFSFLDSQALSGECDRAGFWELALRPLKEKVIDSSPASPLVQAYWMCRDNAFGAFVLERLLALMVQDGWRLCVWWLNYRRVRQGCPCHCPASAFCWRYASMRRKLIPSPLRVKFWRIGPEIYHQDTKAPSFFVLTLCPGVLVVKSVAHIWFRLVRVRLRGENIE